MADANQRYKSNGIKLFYRSYLRQKQHGLQLFATLFNKAALFFRAAFLFAFFS
jgi:hypothetical protein